MEGLSRKKKKTHGLVQQCGDGGVGEVEEGMGINSNGENTI